MYTALARLTTDVPASQAGFCINTTSLRRRLDHSGRLTAYNIGKGFSKADTLLGLSAGFELGDLGVDCAVARFSPPTG